MKKEYKVINYIQRYYSMTLVSIVTTLAFYSVYFQKHYSVDVYSHLMTGYDNIIPLFLNEGRFTGRIFSWIIYYIFRINPVKDQYAVMLLCTALFSITILVTYSALKNELRINTKIKEIILFIFVSQLYLNPFFCDWYQFMGVVYVFSLGLLLVVLAGIIIAKDKELTSREIIISVVLLIFGIGAYQVLGSYYFIISLLIIFIRYSRDNEKKFLTIEYIKRIVWICINYGIASVINLLAVKLWSNNPERSKLQADVLLNIQKVFSEQKTIWVDNMNTMPKYVFIIAIIILVLILMRLIFSNNRRIILVTLISLCGIYLSIFITHLLLEECWISHRTITAFLGLPCVLGVMIMALTQKNSTYKRNRLCLVVSGLIAIILSFIFLIQTNKISSDLLITNALDHQEIKFIVQCIEDYEQKNGLQINKLAFTNDQYVTYGHEGVVTVKDLNIRALYPQWSRISSINYISGRRFEVVDMKQKIYDEYFKDKNWNSISIEQIIFEDDTAYIAIY